MLLGELIGFLKSWVYSLLTGLLIGFDFCRSTANPPKQITNEKGLVALRTPTGFVAGRGGLGEPLAANFSLFDGHVLVQVPELPAGDDYSVVCERFVFFYSL